MSKLSLGVEKAAKAVAVRPDAVLEQTPQIVIPPTKDELTRSMNALGSGVMLAGWATAATVYAWTLDLRGRPSKSDEKSPLLTIEGFAGLGLRGLESRDTVRYYRSRWEEAIEAGWVTAVTPGDVIRLPEQDFSTATELGGLKSTTGNEWYTPARYIEAAREVLGVIDLDPASSALANETVKAAAIFTTEDNGLERDWWGRVWLNPPYGKGSGLFTSKLVDEYEAGRVEAAVLLLNAYGFDAEWFEPLWNAPICFTDHRIEFTSPSRTSGGPANGNIFVYLGPDEAAFARVFRAFGHVVRVWDEAA